MDWRSDSPAACRDATHIISVIRLRAVIQIIAARAMPLPARGGTGTALPALVPA
jgi:hypothetical protein